MNVRTGLDEQRPRLAQRVPLDLWLSLLIGALSVVGLVARLRARIVGWRTPTTRADQSAPGRHGPCTWTESGTHNVVWLAERETGS